jgi:uncharacterized secreted repeat protein (TIGR03808 family)
MMLSRRALLAASAAALLPGRAFADDTKRLQAGLDEAHAAGKPFVLPAGQLFARTLILKDGAHIIGRPGRSVLSLIGNEPLLVLEGQRRITIEGVTFDGGQAAIGGELGLVTARAVQDLRLDDCEIREAGGMGLRLETTGGRIERSKIINAKSTALFSLDAKGLAITGNTVSGAGDNGILVWRGEKGDDGTIVSQNRISDIRADSGGTGQNGNAINIYKAGGVIVSDNEIRRCRFSAVRNNGGSNVQIHGNNCIGFEESAIWHEFNFDGGTIANNIVEGAMIGIIVTNYGSDNGRLATITGNIIRESRRKIHIGDGTEGGGIAIKAEGELAITGNAIEAADFCGIQIGWATAMDRVACTGNMVNAPEVGIGVSIVPGAGEAVITGNTIAGAKRAIAGMAFDKVVTGDLLKESANAFPTITLQGNAAS